MQLSQREITRRIWRGMKKRCLNKRDKRYKSYGGRGITIDPRWMDFELFLEDMGFRPEDRQLERIDNDKGYCKQNCKWATRLEQQNNTRANRWLEYNGKRQTLSQWARELNVDSSSIIVRLRTMSVAQALSAPFVRRDWGGAQQRECPHCQHRWTTRTKKPSFCPNCHRDKQGIHYMTVWHARRNEKALD